MAYADGNIIIGTSVDVGGMNTGLAKIQKTYKRFARIAALTLGGKAFFKLSQAATDAASDLVEVQNMVDQTFKRVDESGNILYDYTDKLKAFTDVSIEQFGMSVVNAKQTAASFMAMGLAMSLDAEKAADLAVSLSAMTGDMASFYNLSQDYARTALSAVYTGETETMKRYGIILTEANLQEYALTKGIDKKVKAMGAADKALLRYQYIIENASYMQDDFARTSQTWANQTRLLKENWKTFLITLGNGMISVLSPLLQSLNAIVAKLEQWANILWQIVHNIFGVEIQSLEEQNEIIGEMDNGIGNAADGMSDLANETTKAGNAAKKALGYYDDLNVIKKDKSSGSSDGKTDYFSDLDISQYEFKSKLIEDLQSQISTFFDWGKSIGDKISEGLKSIDWDRVYSATQGFGYGLARFLNGLISTDTFSEVAATIADSLNAAIYSALSFGITFDWSQLGQKIGDGINKFLVEFDWDAFAETINTFAEGLLTAIGNALVTINWSKAFMKLGELFLKLDWPAILGLVFIKKIISAHIVKNVIAGISSGLGIASISEAAIGFGKAIGSKIAYGIQLTALAGEVIFQDLRAGMSLSEALMAELGITMGTVAGVAGIVGLIAIPIAITYKMIKDNWEGVPFDEVVEKSTAIAVENQQKGALEMAKGWDDFKDKISGVWDDIQLKVQGVSDSMKDYSNTTSAEIASYQMYKVSDIKKSWNSFKEKFNSNFDNMKQNQTNGINAMATSWDTFTNNVKTKWSAVKTNWKTTNTEMKQNFSAGISTMKVDWNSFVSNTKSKIGEIKTKFKTVFDDIKTNCKTNLNSIIGFVERLVNKVIDGINTIIDGINKIKITTPNWAKDKLGIGDLGFNIQHASKISIPRLATGAVIPPNKEFLAVLGDQKKGTNIETPLKTMIEAFNVALDSRETSGNNQPIVLQLNGKQIAKVVWDEQEKKYKQNLNYSYA